MVSTSAPAIHRPSGGRIVYLTFEGLRESRTIAEKQTRVRVALPLSEVGKLRDRLAEQAWRLSRRSPSGVGPRRRPHRRSASARRSGSTPRRRRPWGPSAGPTCAPSLKKSSRRCRMSSSGPYRRWTVAADQGWPQRWASALFIRKLPVICKAWPQLTSCPSPIAAAQRGSARDSHQEPGPILSPRCDLPGHQRD
jgi:hypothetical protein